MRSEKRSGSLMIYFLLAVLLVVTAVLLKAVFVRYIDRGEDREIMSSGFETRYIILDAGHGGQDGGAVSVTGTTEKVLNLKTAETLAPLMKALGFRVIMTRADDRELSCPETGGSRKMQDLMGRLKIAQENPTAVFVSLHMNKFPQSRYRGLQVYYSPNHNESGLLAAGIQASVKAALQPGNDREPKAAGSNIFLLHRIQSPAVLVECGFLSNPEEAALLEQEDYRQRLCLVIGAALAEGIGKGTV